MTPKPLRVTISPLAEAKMRSAISHASPNEVGGLLIFHPTEPFLITDIFFPKQEVKPTYVEFDDNSIADWFEYNVLDLNNRPPREWRYGWWHHHPFNNSQPSGKDEDTHTRHFTHANIPWSIMMITCDGAGDFCRLRVNVDGGAYVDINPTVIYGRHRIDLFPGEENFLDELEKLVVATPLPSASVTLHNNCSLYRSYGDYVEAIAREEREQGKGETGVVIVGPQPAVTPPATAAFGEGPVNVIRSMQPRKKAVESAKTLNYDIGLRSPLNEKEAAAFADVLIRIVPQVHPDLTLYLFYVWQALAPEDRITVKNILNTTTSPTISNLSTWFYPFVIQYADTPKELRKRAAFFQRISSDRMPSCVQRATPISSTPSATPNSESSSSASVPSGTPSPA